MTAAVLSQAQIVVKSAASSAAATRHSPMKRRKGVPMRAPKPVDNSDQTAVYITLPFTGYHPPHVRKHTAADFRSHSPSKKFSAHQQQQTPPPSSSGAAPSTAPSASAALALAARSKARVRFVGDSFFGSNRFWWTRATRPSPLVSSSDSESGATRANAEGSGGARQDDSDSGAGPATATSGFDRNGSVPSRRGGRGRGRGGRGRGRGGWRGRKI